MEGARMTDNVSLERQEMESRIRVYDETEVVKN